MAKWSGENFPPLQMQSPESAVWKFAWLNALKIRDAQAAIRACEANAGERAAMPHTWLAWIAGNEKQQAFSRSFICAALGPDAWLLFEMDLLRFCPICLESGFHSWWHQCRLHSACLVHACPIVDSCQHCGLRIFLYGDQQMREPFICRHCHHPVAGGEASFETFYEFEPARPVVSARYGPWVRWLNDLAELFREWGKIGGVDGYKDLELGRIGRRAARELRVIVSMCPTPDGRFKSPRGGTVVRIIDTQFLHGVTYDPAVVIRDVLATVTRSFDRTDFDALNYCRANFHDGLRIRGDALSAEVLAAWILELYCFSRKPAPGELEKMELTEEDLWVRRLIEPYVHDDVVGADDLFEVLVAVYSEVLEWLTPNVVRRCFNLELERFRQIPGASGYVCRHPRQLMIIRGQLSWETDEAFFSSGARHVTGVADIHKYLGPKCTGPHFFSRCRSQSPCRHGATQWNYMSSLDRQALAAVFRESLPLLLGH